MKKIFMGIVFLLSFFIFSLNASAGDWLTGMETSSGQQILFDNAPAEYVSDCYNKTFFGDKLCENGNLGTGLGSRSGTLNARRDYYFYYHPELLSSNDTFNNYKDVFSYLQEIGAGLYERLLLLLPENASIKDYYTISYKTNINTSTSSFEDTYIDLYLIFYDAPIVFTNHDNGISGYDFEEPLLLNENTFVYKFKLTNSTIIYKTYYTYTYKNILSSFPNVSYRSNIDNYYHVSTTFYNYFYMSNFTILPDTENVKFVPSITIPAYADYVRGLTYSLYDDVDNFYKLDYFRKYAFSGGTLGIQPIYNIYNYEIVNSPPYNGEYSQILLDYTHSLIQLDSKTENSTIYYNGSAIIIYTENDKPSLKKDTFFVNCDRGINDKSVSNLCMFDLDFNGLENPGLIVFYDEKRIVNEFKFNLPVYPIIWYKSNHFNLFTNSVYDWEDYTCFNCEPDENGNLPNKTIKRDEINDFLDLIDIKQIADINDVSALGSIFSNAFSGAKSILNSGIEILSLVTSFFNSLSSSVKAILLLIFLTSIIAIFIRNIM